MYRKRLISLSNSMFSFIKKKLGYQFSFCNLKLSSVGHKSNGTIACLPFSKFVPHGKQEYWFKLTILNEKKKKDNCFYTCWLSCILAIYSKAYRDSLQKLDNIPYYANDAKYTCSHGYCLKSEGLRLLLMVSD